MAAIQLERAKVTATQTCRRCGGKGFRTTWNPDLGRCWGCDATGVRPSAWSGEDVLAMGWVRRPRQQATVEQIVVLLFTNPATKGYKLIVYTTRLDGSIHRWETRDAAKGQAALDRAAAVLQREMTEDALKGHIAELGLFPSSEVAA